MKKMSIYSRIHDEKKFIYSINPDENGTFTVGSLREEVHEQENLYRFSLPISYNVKKSADLDDFYFATPDCVVEEEPQCFQWVSSDSKIP